MQNKGIIDIVTNKNQGKPDMKCSFYLGLSLRKKNKTKPKNNPTNQPKNSDLSVYSLIIKKQNPSEKQAGQKRNGRKSQHVSWRKPPCFAIRNPASETVSIKPLILYIMYGFGCLFFFNLGQQVKTSRFILLMDKNLFARACNLTVWLPGEFGLHC